MTLALEAMKETADSKRNEVIVPAYTCYSVPAAVIRAGLQPRLCDIDPLTLSPRMDDLKRFDTSRVLAVVSANLYGVPNDLSALEAVAESIGAYMFDDSAQALGARIDGRPAGAFGDLGLYSFDKGKNITTLQGGALVAKSGPLAQAIEKICSRLSSTPLVDVLILLAKLPVYSALLRPSLYGGVRKLPFLRLGQTTYEERYPISTLSRILGGLGSRMLERLQHFNQIRVANAHNIAEALYGVEGIHPIQPLPTAEPVYARYPVLIQDSKRREIIIAAMDRAGIGATASYPLALCDVPEIARALPADDLALPGARRVAKCIMTLPTHAYCPPDMPARIRDIAVTALGP